MGSVVAPPSFYQLLLKVRDCILIPDCLSRLKKLKKFFDDLKNTESTIGDYYFP